MQVRVLSGALRGARWITASGNRRYWLGLHEPWLQALLCASLHSGQVFYDVGAHVGFFSLLGARVVGPTGEVVAFEPHPRNAAFLRRHVAINRLNDVTIAEMAVSNRAGHGTLQEGENSYVARLAVGGSLAVAVTTLDLYSQTARRPDLIKIDTEGTEADVIEGARLLLALKHPRLVISVHDPDGSLPLTAVLQELGYNVDTVKHTRAPEACTLVARHPPL